MPTYNRASVLRRSLPALAAQDLSSQHFEVLVCDDGSSDDTRECVEKLQADLPIAIRYLPAANQGANAARNRGVAAARHEILLFLNDDTIATSSLLREHLAAHDEHPDEPGLAVLGRVTIDPQVPYSPFAHVHLDANFALWEGCEEVGWEAFYTCNVSVRRHFLIAHGLFREGLRYHEDVELSERLSEHGLRVLYRPRALGTHWHLLTEGDYLGVAEKEGKALAQWLRSAPEKKLRLHEVGLPYGPEPRDRMRHRVGDFLFGPLGMRVALPVARFLLHHSEDAGLELYRKLYQARMRLAFRRETGRAA